MQVRAAAATRHGVLSVSCRFLATPGSMGSGRRTTDVHATIGLAVEGRAPVSRDVIVPDDHVSLTYAAWWEGVQRSLDVEVARAVVTHHPEGDAD